MAATAGQIASNIASIRAQREARRTDIRHLAREARTWAAVLDRVLWDAAEAPDDGTLRAKVAEAFQHEVTLLGRMTALADVAPESARKGRTYGQRLRDVALRATEADIQP